MFKKLPLLLLFFSSLLGTAIAQTKLEVSVNSSTDDAEQLSATEQNSTGLETGDLDLSSSDLELVDDATWNGTGQTVGIRFSGITIPKGAIILEASIAFEAKASNSEETNLEIRGELAADAATFANTPNNISARPTTAALTAWNDVEPWTSGEMYDTPDLSDVVAEIVNQDDWTSGNALSFIISGTGVRNAQSFDGTTAPKLTVVYLPVTALEVEVTDDAEELSATEQNSTGLEPGDLDLTSSDLELVDDATWNGTGQTVGLRFDGLNIPQNAEIVEAYMVFEAKASNAETTNLMIHAEDADDAAAFVNSPNNISNRSKTSASIDWSGVEAWTTGETYMTPDLSSLIAEVVAKEGWTSGNALSFIIEGSGVRNAQSANGSTAPKLVVKFVPKASVGIDASDDAEELSATEQNSTGLEPGDLDLGSSDLELVDDATWNGTGQTVGIRFDNIDIPQNGIVTKAYIEFVAKASNAEETNLMIKAELADDAAAFANTPNNISSRATTTAAVDWSAVEAWTTGQTYTTPDLSELIEEVVAQDGWMSGNALSFIITGSGVRNAQSLDGTVAPKLVLEFLQGEVKEVPVLLAEIPDQQLKAGWSFNLDAGKYFQDKDSELTFTATGLRGEALPAEINFADGEFSGTINKALALQIVVTAKSDGDSVFDIFTLNVEPQQEKVLTQLGSIDLGGFDEGAAEISAYNKDAQKLFVTNSQDNAIDIIDISDPTNFKKVKSIDIAAVGGTINSVATVGHWVAAAIEAPNKQDPGFIYVFDTTGAELWNVTVGALPDMVTYNEDGTKIIVANEGEPSGDYLTDPEGSVSIIDTVTKSVSTATFTAYNGQEATLKAQGIRIFGPNATVAQDMEPEYITVKGNIAYVACQENNAIAVVDITTATVTDLIGMGYKDHSQPGMGLDVPEVDGPYIANFPFKGVYMPDAITSFEVGGTTYIVTANEGDAREYEYEVGGDDVLSYTDESEIGELPLDPATFSNIEEIEKYAEGLGVSVACADTTTDGLYKEIFTYGARSFSIWNGETGALVYDSGDEFEQITAALYPLNFNAADDDVDAKDRSDNKGPEPEAVAVGEVDGVTYAFVGLERMGGIMVYDITDPMNVKFVEYVNNRDFSTDPEDDDDIHGDNGPEGLIFIPAADSPNNTAMVVVSNEISGTVTAYSVGEAVENYTLAIFHNNDGESDLLPDSITYLGKPMLGGSVSQFKYTLDSLKDQATTRGYESIMLSSGDNFLAGPEYNAGVVNDIYYDAKALDAIGYDAIDLGNHDFDFGTTVLAEFINAFETTPYPPYLSSNLGFKDVPELQTLVENDRIKSSTIVNKGGEEIGIIGLTTPLLPTISSPGNTLVSEEIIDSVQKQVSLLQNAGVNKIILISHLQNIAEDVALAAEVTGIDIMIAGGGDEFLANDPSLGEPYNITPYDEYPIVAEDKDGKDVYIVTTPGNYRYLGNLLVDFNDAGEVVKVYDSNPVLVVGPSDATLKAEIEDPIEEYLEDIATNVIAITEDDLDFRRETLRGKESNGGNLFADAILWQAKEVYNSFGVSEPMVALQNSGGLRIESIIEEGDITELMTYEVAAFTNIVSVVEDITPAKFLELVEHGVGDAPSLNGKFPQIAGFEIVYDQGVDAGDRVISITLDNGTKIVENGEVVGGAPNIHLATIDFTAGGGDGYPFDPLTYTTLGVTYQQAFYNYLTDANALNGVVADEDYPFGMNDRILVEVTRPDAVAEVDENFDATCPEAPADWVEYHEGDDLITCSGNGIQFNGYGIGTGISWLISPRVTFDADDYEMEFDSRNEFDGPDPVVLYSTDYNGLGDPTEANWTEVSAASSAFQSNAGSVANSGKIDLSFLTEEAYIAFVYESEGTSGGQSTRLALDNVLIAPVVPIVSAGIKEIYEIQGDEEESPLKDQQVITGGVVTAYFNGVEPYTGAGYNGNIEGFFFQDVEGDGDVATSDGIFVDSDMAVSVGDSITFKAIVREQFGRTTLTEIDSVVTVTTGITTPAAVSITLPLSSPEEFEQFEGMKVMFSQTMTVTETRNVDYAGELKLAQGGLLIQPTQVVDPNDADAEETTSDASDNSNVAAVTAKQDENWARSFTLSDARSGLYPDPIPYLNNEGLILAGTEVSGIEGVLNYNYGEYMVEPTAAPSFNYATREAKPSLGDATLTVVAFNVLNYFNGDGQGGGFPTSRGASNLEEFKKQTQKIVAAIIAMDADIIGLNEIENEEDDGFSAIKSLVDSINVEAGAGVYDFVATGKISREDGSADEIKVGYIYKTTTVALEGDYAILNNAEDANFFDEKSRPALAQTFKEKATGEVFTAVVNHLKSKGSDCEDLSDPDDGDGQANCAGTRASAAEAIASWLETDPTNSGDNDFLIFGDLNSYAQEDPIDALRAAGYTNLVDNTEFTYVFDGQYGSLDYAMGNANLNGQVTEAAVWHINSIEPDYQAYDGDWDYFNADPYWSSDHDPVMIGLKLVPPTGVETFGYYGEVRFFPNPSTGIVNFSKSISGTVVDPLGVPVKTLNNAINVDLNGYPQGMYMLILDTGHTVKLVIE